MPASAAASKTLTLPFVLPIEVCIVVNSDGPLEVNIDSTYVKAIENLENWEFNSLEHMLEEIPELTKFIDKKHVLSYKVEQLRAQLASAEQALSTYVDTSSITLA